MKQLLPIVIIGGGTMGEILLQALLRVHPASAIVVAETNVERAGYLTKEYAVRAVPLNSELVDAAQTVVLAVKPQDYAGVVSSITDGLHGQLIISIMAGISTTSLVSLCKSSRVIRAMPNTPAKIGLGMTVWTHTIDATDGDVTFGRSLFASFGQELFMQDDDKIDKATAINGSGPAYLFLFAEQLMVAAQAIGLAEAQARVMVSQTLRGASELLAVSQASPRELREQVTSKKGTTAAAIESLPQDTLQQAWTLAIAAAYARSKQLHM